MDERFIVSIIETAKESDDFDKIINAILHKVQRNTGFHSIGIRIINEEGDYPYYVYTGFSKDFVKKENSLCVKDQNGNIVKGCDNLPVVECMCGNILRGRFNPEYPFFTRGGSFYSNCTSDLLAKTSEKERQARTRNRCNGEGYESVGLFPLKYDSKVIGLLQLNDYRKNMFSEDDVLMYEMLAKCIGDIIYFAHLCIKIKEKKIVV